MKKTKGFTLIELIAVIAILAILGAVLVPKILGYKTKAKRSNAQTSAKEIVHAIQAYNADKETDKQVSDGTDVATAVDTVNTDGGDKGSIIKTSGDEYTSLSGLKVSDLCGVANGDFNMSSTGAITVTKPGSISD